MNSNTLHKTELNENHWKIVPLVFTLAVLAPEYVAPFLLVFGVIMTMRKKGFGKKSFNSFSVGYALMLFMCWMVVGVFYANSFISALASVGLWILMFSGFWFCGEWLDSEEKVEKVIYGGAFAGGFGGLIGIVQAGARALLSAEKASIINPIWRFLDLLIEKLVIFLPDFISSSMGKQTFSQFPTRSCGTFTNPLFFATFQVAMIPFAVYCFFNGKKRSERIFGFVMMLLSLGGLAFSFSRGPYIAAALSFVLLLLYGGKRALKILAIGFAGGVAVLTMFSDVVNRLLTLGSNTDYSINTRKLIWTAVFEKIPDKFLFGYGTGFDSVRSILHNEYKIIQPHAHNILLEIQMENGIIGVVLFLAMCLLFTFNMYKLYRKGGTAKAFAVTFFVSFAGMCMCGLTDCIFYGLKPLQYMMLVLGVGQACMSIYFKDEKIFTLKEKKK